MKKAMLILMACLLAGGGLGYLVSYLNYTPVLEDYVAQINNQNNELSRLVQINCNLEQTITNDKVLIAAHESNIDKLEDESANQKITIANQRGEISTLEGQNKDLEIDLDEAKNEIEEYKEDLQDKTNKINSLGNKISDLLDIEVNQYYEWIYSGSWKWDIPITLSSYVEYRDRPRPKYASEFVDMVNESEYDPCIRNLVAEFSETASTRGFSDRGIANFIAAFVQSMPYTVDYDTKKRDEYPRYPVETLFERGGDCEDTSILVATLLDSMGIDVVLLELTYENHMAVGINVPVSYGTYYEYLGEKYWYLETTAEGWKLGEYPSKLKDGRAHIYPLRG